MTVNIMNDLIEYYDDICITEEENLQMLFIILAIRKYINPRKISAFIYENALSIIENNRYLELDDELKSLQYDKLKLRIQSYISLSLDRKKELLNFIYLDSKFKMDIQFCSKYINIILLIQTLLFFLSMLSIFGIISVNNDYLNLLNILMLNSFGLYLVLLYVLIKSRKKIKNLKKSI